MRMCDCSAAVLEPSMSFHFDLLGWFNGNGIVIYRSESTKSTMQKGKR